MKCFVYQDYHSPVRMNHTKKYGYSVLFYCIINKLYRNVCVLYKNVYMLYIQYIYNLLVCISTSGIVYTTYDKVNPL